ncbi:hypothetical protein ATCC90586_007127 [Pythium insidiosum]|nr:hypothetical protein ATCC90586_007127 [Pythium insidiosum]
MTDFVPVQFKSLETTNAYIADQSLHWITSRQRLREELRIVTRRLASTEAANEEMYKDREDAQSLCTAVRARFIKFKHEQIIHDQQCRVAAQARGVGAAQRRRTKRISSLADGCPPGSGADETIQVVGDGSSGFFEPKCECT